MKKKEVINNEEVEETVNFSNNNSEFIFDLKGFGILSFRSIISCNDFIEIEKYREVDNEKTFVLKFIYSHIIDPKCSFEEFSNISEKEITEIIPHFLKENETLTSIFDGTSDSDVETRFKFTIEQYCDKLSNDVREAALSVYNTQFYQDVPKLLTSFQRGMQGMQEIIANVNRSYSEFYRVSLPLFNSIVEFQTLLASNTEIFNQLRRNLTRFRITIEEADQISMRYKWLITPSLLTDLVTLVLEVYNDPELSSRKKSSAINKLFVNYFRDDNYLNLSQMIETWEENPLFDYRMKIIRDCVWTLKNSKGSFNASNLILPTLIAQIDGIITDYIKQKGWSYVIIRKNTRKWVDQTGTRSVQYGNNYHCFEDIAPGEIDFIDSPNYVIMKILFQKAYNGDKLETPFTFSRHKIMHGEYKSYGRIDNTIRAFLILDFLASLN